MHRMPESNAAMLPPTVRPIRYDLTLAPRLDDFAFRGEETVDIEVLEPTTRITLNCVTLTIRSCRVVLPDGSTRTPTDTSLMAEEETVTFTFREPLPEGQAKIRIEFTGELNDRLRGFYRSKYTDQNGEERYLATTQFEATDARRAFPCWDEPGLKASFQVTLLIPSDLAAVSNMPIAAETEASPGLKRVTFAETPVMSTYLLAFVVGDLRAIEQPASDGTLVRVWATAGKEEQGRFALEVSVKLLAYFNEYFGIPYPLEKLDHLAIPDFAAGAMENWGAITYRENAVLVDPQNSSAVTRQRVAGIVAHEMAHMWFGDLVTMAWWNDLWLNESFASWVGDKAVDHLFPEWEMWTQFVSEDTNSALSMDGLQNSHPIEQQVNNPAEIGELFDAISYSKGGSILRMLERFLGPETFRQGLHGYLDRHQYGNALTRDLWNVLGEVSGQPVAAIMDTWVKQTGYPVVNVETNRGEEGIEVTASQNRFVYEHVSNPDAAYDTLWAVPLSVRTGGDAQSTSVLMDGRQAKVRLTALRGREAREGWIKVNPEQTGFYRVNYSSKDWGRLRPAIEELLLPPADRLGIQNDAYALSKAGFLPVTQFLALAQAYVNETNAYVWADLAANLGNLDTLLASEPYYPRFQALARGIFHPAGQRAGWDARHGEGHLDTLMRSTVLMELGDYGDEDSLAEASSRFGNYPGNPDSVHPDIRRVVLGLAAKRGVRSTYDTMWELQKSATLEEERLRLLMALTQFQHPELLGETLRRSLSPDVRVHNTIALITGVASNRKGLDLAWEFLKANWQEFDRRYGEGGFALMRLVGFTSRFSTQEKLDDVESFFEANPAPAAEGTIRRSLERIKLNIAWLDRNGKELSDWLAG